jgi:hypothetical protein
MRILIAAASLAVLAATGCHSAYIEATVKNSTGAAVQLVEVDYPSASFGRTALAADADYNYRFKILGSGPTKVLWTDPAHHEHSVNGPPLHEGQEGKLTITLTATTVTWDFAPTRP